ncbi:hypothetical protein SLA2020_005510 [Shorea laevis]
MLCPTKGKCITASSLIDLVGSGVRRRTGGAGEQAHYNGPARDPKNLLIYFRPGLLTLPSPVKSVLISQPSLIPAPAVDLSCFGR